MYSFILNLWVTGQLTEAKVNGAVTKGFITPEQRDMILATPQVP